MRLQLVWLGALGLLLTTPTAAGAQAPRAGLIARTGLGERVDALVLPYVAAGMFNGVVLVAQGDEILLTQAYGMASYELGAPLRTDSRFRIASLSKQFTNAALAVLIDRGILTPATRVAEFLPDFPRGDEITVDHLVNHQSGVPHTNDLAQLKGVTRMSLDEIVRLLATRELDFTPGTEERYSNGGYDLLAAIIEAASGASFEEFLAREVFKPLRLLHSGRLHTYEVVPGLVQGYLPGPRPGVRSQPRFYPAEIRVGGGSLYASAADVFRLFRSTFQREFATDATSDFLFWDATRRYEITGRSPGFAAKVFIDIPNDITVVSLANNYSFLVSWGRRLYQAALNEPWETADLTAVPHTIPDSQAAYYEGLYATKWDRGVLSVSPEGHLLYADRENDWEVALIPLAENRYLHPFFETICRFEGVERAESMVCNPALQTIEESKRFERVR